MPYKKSQVAEYGPSFVPWEEEQFSQMLGSLTGGLHVWYALLSLDWLFVLIVPSLIGTIAFRVEMDEDTFI